MGSLQLCRSRAHRSDAGRGSGPHCETAILRQGIVDLRPGNVVHVVADRLDANDGNQLVEFGASEAEIGKLLFVDVGQPAALVDDASRGTDEALQPTVLRKPALVDRFDGLGVKPDLLSAGGVSSLAVVAVVVARHGQKHGLSLGCRENPSLLENTIRLQVDLGNGRVFRRNFADEVGHEAKGLLGGVLHLLGVIGLGRSRGRHDEKTVGLGMTVSDRRLPTDIGSLSDGLAFTYAGEYLTGTAGAFPSLLRRLRGVVRQSVTTESMKAWMRRS